MPRPLPRSLSPLAGHPRLSTPPDPVSATLKECLEYHFFHAYVRYSPSTGDIIITTNDGHEKVLYGQILTTGPAHAKADVEPLSDIPVNHAVPIHSFNIIRDDPDFIKVVAEGPYIHATPDSIGMVSSLFRITLCLDKGSTPHSFNTAIANLALGTSGDSPIIIREIAL